MPNRSKIDPIWRTDPAFARVMTALGAPGVDVRAVGGAVRDAVLGQDRRDTEIDIGTPEPPETVIKRLSDAGLRVVPTGLAHGTVTAVVDDRTFEITSLRRDTACDGRHAAVEFTTNWEEDSRRRDFTCNAMSMAPDGTLYDYQGGQKDLDNGDIRFIGDPADRIKEDYLRILRLFRFIATRDWAPDIETMRACAAHKVGLARLSGERIQAELAKILRAQWPVLMLTLVEMRMHGVLAVLLPLRVKPETSNGLTELSNLLLMEKASCIDDGYWLRRLAALIPPVSVDEVAERLKLSNDDRKTLSALLAPAPNITPRSSDIEIDNALFFAGAETMRDRVLLASDPYTDAQDWCALLARIAAWVHRPLPVTGDDVLALGIAPGPKVGELLAAMTTWWIENRFQPSRDDTLAKLKRLASKR